MTQHEQGVKNVKKQFLCWLDTNAMQCKCIAAERSRLTLKTSVLPQMLNAAPDFETHLELIAGEKWGKVHSIAALTYAVHHLAEINLCLAQKR